MHLPWYHCTPLELRAELPEKLKKMTPEHLALAELEAGLRTPSSPQ